MVNNEVLFIVRTLTQSVSVAAAATSTGEKLAIIAVVQCTLSKCSFMATIIASTNRPCGTSIYENPHANRHRFPCTLQFPGMVCLNIHHGSDSEADAVRRCCSQSAALRTPSDTMLHAGCSQNAMQSVSEGGELQSENCGLQGSWSNVRSIVIGSSLRGSVICCSTTLSPTPVNYASRLGRHRFSELSPLSPQTS